MDPVLCCLMGLCCPPFSAEQQETFKKVLHDLLKDEKKAEKIAKTLAHDLGKLTMAIHELAKGDA